MSENKKWVPSELEMMVCCLILIILMIAQVVWDFNFTVLLPFAAGVIYGKGDFIRDPRNRQSSLD